MGCSAAGLLLRAGINGDASAGSRGTQDSLPLWALRFPCFFFQDKGFFRWSHCLGMFGRSLRLPQRCHKKAGVTRGNNDISEKQEEDIMNIVLLWVPVRCVSSQSLKKEMSRLQILILATFNDDELSVEFHSDAIVLRRPPPLIRR